MEMRHLRSENAAMQLLWTKSKCPALVRTLINIINSSCQSREQTEQALAATAVPLEVSKECLTLRDGRRGHELVADPVEEQLQKEVALIERVQRDLQQHVDRAFEHLW